MMILCPHGTEAMSVGEICSLESAKQDGRSPNLLIDLPYAMGFPLIRLSLTSHHEIPVRT